MAKRGLYYELVRQQEKHGITENSTLNLQNTTDERNSSSINKNNSSSSKSGDSRSEQELSSAFITEYTADNINASSSNNAYFKTKQRPNSTKG